MVCDIELYRPYAATRRRKVAEVVEEGAVALVEDAADERADGLVVLGVGVDPARVHLGLVEGLEHVVLDPLDERRLVLGLGGSSGQAPTSVW